MFHHLGLVDWLIDTCMENNDFCADNVVVLFSDRSKPLFHAYSI